MQDIKEIIENIFLEAVHPYLDEIFSKDVAYTIVADGSERITQEFQAREAKLISIIKAYINDNGTYGDPKKSWHDEFADTLQSLGVQE